MVYRIPSNLLQADPLTCVNYRGSAASSSCVIRDISPPEYRAWPLIPRRPSRPTDPHISPRRAARRQQRQQSLLWACKEKVRAVAVEMHGCSPGFSGFLVALIYLAACKEKKKKRMRLFTLCCKGAGEALCECAWSVLLLKKGVFFTLSYIILLFL